MSLAPFFVLTLLIGMTAVGVWHSRKVRNAEDFALAGRGLSAWALSGTLIATLIGTGSILGNAEMTYKHGVAGFWLPISGVLGMLVLVRLAPLVRGREARTVPELIGQSFGPHVRRLGAVALIAAYLIIVSYQYRAGAAVAERLLGPLDWPGSDMSMWPVACAGFVILYTALAGLMSVAATDNIAGIVIIVGVLLAVPIVWMGWDVAADPLPSALLEPAGGFGARAWMGMLLPTFLLMLGDANLMQRFLAAKAPNDARRAAWITLLALLVIESALIALALLGRARLGPYLDNPAHVILVTAFELLPAWMGLALIAAIVSVVISTADSFLLAASNSASLDLFFRTPNVAHQRWHVIGMGLVALGLAYVSDEFFRVALFAYTIYGVTLTPAVVLAIVRPRIPRQAILAGMAAGLGATLWAKQAGWGDEAVLWGLGSNLLALFLWSKGPLARSKTAV